VITIDVKELMNRIINEAIEKRASDIHIYPHISGNSFIKLRVNGHLSKYEKYSNRELEQIISLLKFNANIDISRNKEPQSGRFVYNYNEKDYFLRVSTLPLSELNEGCVVRIFINELEDVDYSIFEEDNQYINNLSKNIGIFSLGEKKDWEKIKDIHFGTTGQVWRKGNKYYYFDDLGVYQLIDDVVYEIVDNAVDEALSGYATKIEVTQRNTGK